VRFDDITIAAGPGRTKIALEPFGAGALESAAAQREAVGPDLRRQHDEMIWNVTQDEERDVRRSWPSATRRALRFSW